MILAIFSVSSGIPPGRFRPGDFAGGKTVTRKHIQQIQWRGTVLFLGLALVVAEPSLAHDVDHHHKSHALTSPAPSKIYGPELQTDIRQLVGNFRRTGDDHYLDVAWARLEPLLVEGRSGPEVLIDAAMIAQSRHDFGEALKLVYQALERSPGNFQAWLLVASIRLVLGDNDAAAYACAQLRNVPLLVTVTCKARVALTQDATAAPVRQLIALLAALPPEDSGSGLLAWSLAVAGDAMVRSEEHGQAVGYYERSLRSQESTQVRAALVDTLLLLGKYDRAETILTAGAPALPLVVRAQIVAKRIGHPSQDLIDRMDAEFQSWIRNDDWLHAREMARFYLDVLERPALARQLAVMNLTQQREPEDLLLELRTR